MSDTTTEEPLFDPTGNHWGVHGPEVYQAQDHQNFARFAALSVYSQLKRTVYMQPTVLLTCCGSPCYMSFAMSAEDARKLAANLVVAAARVQDVEAALAAQPA